MGISEKQFDRLFAKWLKLRTKFKDAKSTKNWQRVVAVAGEIIEFDKSAKEVGIFLPLFEAAIADAYLKLEDRATAIAHYRLALAGYVAENAAKPDSWLKEIARITQKLEKLESKP
jgi:hypothetical protein